MKKSLCVVVLIVCSLLQGCLETLVNAPKDATDSLSEAIDVLAQESSDWRSTLQELEAQLARDGKDLLAHEVTQVMQKGIATGGTEIRCNYDFIRTRMKKDLERILARLENRPVPPVEPALCQVVPTFIDMNNPPPQMEFYGYDLNAPGGIEAVLQHSGGETSLNAWLAMPTHYLVTLDVRSADAICNKENRKILLRHQGQDVSSTNVTRKACPKAPEPPPQRVVKLWGGRDSIGSSISGTSEDRVYGTACSPGHLRSHFNVFRESGSGSCYATGTNPRNPDVRLGWVSDNARDCRIRVHYGVDWGVGHNVTCKMEIFQITEPAPRQPDPPCGCW